MWPWRHGPHSHRHERNAVGYQQPFGLFTAKKKKEKERKNLARKKKKTVDQYKNH
jgi:hypothetical protein